MPITKLPRPTGTAGPGRPTKKNPVGRPRKPVPSSVDRTTSILWGLFKITTGRTSDGTQITGDYVSYSALFGGVVHTISKNRG